MVPPFQPRQLRVTWKEVSPALKRFGHFDSDLLRLLHDWRARIRREDVCPEFRTRKTTANVHHEIDGLPALGFALSRRGKDDVDRRWNPRLKAPCCALVNRLKILEVFVHRFQDLG